MRCWFPWTVVSIHTVYPRTPLIATHILSYLTRSIVQRNMSAGTGNSKPGSKEVSPSTVGKSPPKSKSKISKNKNAESSSSDVEAKTAGETETSSEVPDTSSSTSPIGGRVTRQNIRKREEIEEIREKYLSMDLQSKRKLYKGTYVTLEKIKTWPDYFREDLKQKTDKSKLGKEKGAREDLTEKEVREDLNKKISLFQGDITTLEIDAIVNAANESLLGGGGVDGAIHQAAGPHLRSECATLHGCQPGQAKITCGYNLAAKYIIHTVGPRGEKPQVLNQCYTHSLDLVKEHKLTSVAFPCISTGIFGYPNVNAAKVALSAVRQWLEKDEYAKHVERIIFCLFLKVDVEAYHSLMPVYFPVASLADSNVNESPSADKSEKEEPPSPSSDGEKCDTPSEGEKCDTPSDGEKCGTKEEAELRKD